MSDTKTMYDFGDGAGLVPAHRHKNPGGSLGGWVADTATVHGTAYIGKYCQVFGRAKVLHRAKILDRARVWDNAVIGDDAVVTEEAVVCENAYVYNCAHIYRKAMIYGRSHVHGHARIYGTVKVSDFANVEDNAVVIGNTRICGQAHLNREAFVSNNTQYANISIDGYVITFFKTKTGIAHSWEDGFEKDYSPAVKNYLNARWKEFKDAQNKVH